MWTRCRGISVALVRGRDTVSQNRALPPSDSPCTFGGVEATGLFPSGGGTLMSLTTPAHAAGTVDVVATNPDGSGTLVGGFTYVAADGPAPTITTVTPDRGSTLGGTAITITGTNFRAGASLELYGAATDVVVVNATTITAVTPPAFFASATPVTVTNTDLTFVALYPAFTNTAMCEPPTIVTDCVSQLLVNGVAPPADVSVSLSANASGRELSLQNMSSFDLNELAPDVQPDDTITVELPVPGDFDPVLAFSTGEIQTWQWDAATRIATITLSPRASSWSNAGCAPPPGACAPQASADYSALALVGLDSMPDLSPALRADFQGAFLSTNGQFFTTPSYDSDAGAIGFMVGAPSLRGDGAPNDDGFFNFFIPDAFITNVWGIATPDDLLVPSSSTVTIGSETVVPTSMNVAATATSPPGIALAFEGFSFSVKEVAIIVAPTVTSVSPTSGVTGGGTVVTITGLNFRPGATVTIGGVPASSVVVVNAATITAVTGAGAAGSANVVVSNTDGTADTLASAFSYVAPVTPPSPTPAPTPAPAPAPAPSPVPQSVPGPPTNLTASVAGATVTFAWSAPGVGTAPTFYVLEGGSSPGTTNLPVVNTAMPTTSWSLTLPPGTYYVRAPSGSPSGTSVPSNEVAFIIGGTAQLPGAPTGLAVAVADTRVTMTWQPPAAGGAVTMWQIELGSSAGATDVGIFSVVADTLSVSGTLPAGEYVVRVRGLNAVGAGAASNEVQFIAGGVPACNTSAPGAPVLLPASATNGVVTVSWLPPSGAVVSAYRLSVGTAPGMSNLAALEMGPVTSFTGSAGPGTYYLSVVAINTCGVGPASNTVEVVVPGGGAGPPPSPPTGVEGSVIGNSVTVAWTPVPGATSYVVEAGTAAGASNAGIQAVVGAGFTASGVPPGIYFVRVRAVGAGGTSAPSLEIVVSVP